MRKSRFPKGWNQARVERVLQDYKAQSEEEGIAEDEAAYKSITHTMVSVPVELLPKVRDLIQKRRRVR